MNTSIFEEIAREIKGLSNYAAKLVSEGKLDEAEACYLRVQNTTVSLAYHEGTAMTYFNLANLEVLRGDLIRAIAYGALAKEMQENAGVCSEHCRQLLAKLAKAAMKKGIAHEKNNELIKALEYYRASIPHSEKKFRQAMLLEIELIERLMANE